MPDERVTIGGRDYDVACEAGEEHFLQAAARYLDREAETLLDQMGRMPEARMLLMAGLMLADRTAGLEEQVRAAEARAGELEKTVARMESAPPPKPERVEVPVIPDSVIEGLSELAARSEALAEEVETRASEGETAS